MASEEGWEKKETSDKARRRMVREDREPQEQNRRDTGVTGDEKAAGAGAATRANAFDPTHKHTAHLTDSRHAWYQYRRQAASASSPLATVFLTSMNPDKASLCISRPVRRTSD